jgi:UDP-N-acetylmuramyl pentapeptide phosphotransferase/UDP-N-acetylglucosamine-1-phosphate transferase
MGGVLIVVVILVLAFVFNAFDASTYSPLFVLALVGALGASTTT